MVLSSTKSLSVFHLLLSSFRLPLAFEPTLPLSLIFLDPKRPLLPLTWGYRMVKDGLCPGEAVSGSSWGRSSSEPEDWLPNRDESEAVSWKSGGTC